MADQQQSPVQTQDPLAEYDAKVASAPQGQKLSDQDDLKGVDLQGLVPAGDHEVTPHVLPKGLAVSKNNVHLPTGLVFDDDGTGHVKTPPEQQKQEPGFWDKAKLAVAGPGTAAGQPLPEGTSNEISGVNDMLHGDFKKGGKKIWDAENLFNSNHIIPGSPIEWAIRQFDPDFHGGATAEVRARSASALEKPIVDIAQFIDKDKHPIAKALTEVGQGLTSPENLAIMYGSGGLGLIGKTPQAMKAFGVLNKLISAGFAFQAAQSAYEHSAAFKAALDAGDAPGAEYELTHALMSGVFVAQAGSHAAEGEYTDARTGKSIKIKSMPVLSEIDKAVLGTMKDATTTAAKSVADFTGKKFSAAADRLGSSLGKTADFDEAITRGANMLGKKAGPEFKATVKNVSEDLKAIINNDTDNKIVDPKSAAKAIDDHLKTAIDAPLLQEAGATKDSPEPVVPNFRQRLEERLDKFFSDTAGRYASGDQVESAKQRILDRVEMQHDFGNGVTVPRDPNLFEAENIRQGLNAEGAASPFEDSANIESNAYKAAARETAAFMRETIDESYNDKGVRGVKEARAKEADLIDVRDALKDAQGVADKFAATPSILKLFSIGKMAGMVGAIVAHYASSNFLSGTIAAGTLWKHIHDNNVRDVVGNLERAKALAARAPGAQATVPEPGGPEMQGPSPAPPTPPVTPPPTAPEGFPAPPQPPAPVTPPAVNHRLYGALSTYFGSFLGEQPYQDLMQKFSNQVADMKDDIKNKGGKYSQEQVDAAMKLQGKINDAHAAEHEYVEKQNAANQAKYEKEKIKYEQKLKAELAKQEAQRKTQEQQRTEQVKASLLTDERIAHSPVLKATEEPLEISGIEGRSSEQNHGHEHGHIMAASAEDLEPTQFVTDKHPDAMEDGAAAQVHIDTSMAEKGPKGVAQKVVAILGGPAFDEVHHDMKMSRNTGARDDIARARQILREEGGLRGAALEKVFDALYDRAKEHVSNPEALAVAQANMRVREAGLHPNYHMSAGRMAEYVKKLQGAYGNVKTQSTEVLREGDAGGGDEEGESSDAGRAAEKQDGAAKGVRAETLRESDEGGGEPGRGKSGRLAKAALKTAGPESISDRLAETFGTTQDPHEAGFILSDGRMVPLKNTHNEMLDTLYNKYGDIGMDEAERTAFINNEKAVRTRYRTTKGGPEVVFSVPKSGVAPEQVEQIKKSVGKLRNGNVVMEISEGEGKSAKKEFARVSDVEPMLQQIGALPEKAALKSKMAVPEELADIANKHNAAEGLEPIKEAKLLIDPRQSEMADAYAASKHEPNSPQVKKAYDALKSDLDKQYDLLVKNGYKIDATENDPYEGDQLGVEGNQTGAEAAYQAMRRDVTQNKHISVWKGGAPPADHPLSEVDPKTGLTYNEKFRAVHDILGHVMPDNDFTAEGEESAWGSHNQMFSPDARPALATETRGQTAYVTKFGNFADQRAAILPKEFHGRPEEETGGTRGMPSWWNEQPEENKGTSAKTTKGGKILSSPVGAVNWQTGSTGGKRYGLEIHPESRETLDRKPTAEDFQRFAEAHADTAGQHPDMKIGWDTLGEKPELNVGISTDNLDAAKKVAGKLDQRSVWDSKEEKEIPTGGKGERTSFPDYPIEDRLRDLGIEKASLKKAPKGSSVPLMDNPLKVKGSGEGGEVNTLDLTKALNAFSRKQLPALKPGSEPKEMVQRAKKIAEDEAKYQLAQSKTGTEWYTTEMKDHDKVLQGMRPELATGDVTGDDTAMPGHPVNLTLFKAAEAILSSGQKPYANVKSAVRAWDLYKETGEFPPINPATGKSWGPRNVAAYGNAFEAINKLITDKGEKGAADWLLTDHPVSELREYGENVSGKKEDQRPGATILGEKRGPFMQNLHGIESKFTADMWVSRTWNRWMGTLDLDPRIENKGKVTSESDAPRNNTERGLMRESFEKTAGKLGLTTSSLQAVLWYYEQALYRAHGLPVESWSFSDAAKRVEKEQAPREEQESFPFGESAKGKGVEAGLSGSVLKSTFANISGKSK